MRSFLFRYFVEHEYQVVLDAETLEEAKELFHSEEYITQGIEVKDMGGFINSVKIKELI